MIWTMLQIWAVIVLLAAIGGFVWALTVIRSINRRTRR